MRFAGALLIGFALFLAGCDKSVTPSPTDSQVTTYTFTAALAPSNEVPAVNNAEQGGSGSVTVKLLIAKDSGGNATSASIDFDATFSGFPPGTSLTAAHIHPGVAGVNGGILVNTTIASGEVTMPAGSGSLSKKALTVSVDNANSILANPSAFYFNIHTALNPGGVARGQLNRTQ